MCGLYGEIRLDGAVVAGSGLDAVGERLAARGPHSAGTFARGAVTLGHRRLSVIDLSEASQQPMIDSELGLAIVFNGTIYNYAELREELSRKGYRFFSRGDTEVILKAHHAWGSACVERFHGMFAYAIWERESGSVTLVRDRLGVKPLYWTETENRLRFASSLPALLEGGAVDTSIDPVALGCYLGFHAVVPPPRTILSGVRKLPPATLLTIGPDGRRDERRYWSLRFGPREDERRLTREEWDARTLDALRRAVRRRLVADVPVGVFLSGGLDSSLIVALIAEAGGADIETFSIGFDAVGGHSGDEFAFSDLVAERFGTRHHRFRVGTEGVLADLGRCLEAMSEPMTSHDNIGFFLLSAAASRDVRVVQSGQGADEVFGGYDWYPGFRDSPDPIADYADAIRARGPEECAATVAPAYRGDDHAGAFMDAHLAEPGAIADIDKIMRLDATVMLANDPVMRVDNMTMAFGLEARVPFLDHELVELAARTPVDHKLSDGGKGVLKRAARTLLPDAVIDRPKGYFPVPALKLLRGEVLDTVRDALASERARSRGVFDRGAVDALLAAPQDNITRAGANKLWQVGLLEMWLQAHGA